METDEGNNLSHPAYGLKLTATGGVITSTTPPNITYHSTWCRYAPSFRQTQNASFCQSALVVRLTPRGVSYLPSST